MSDAVGLIRVSRIRKKADAAQSPEVQRRLIAPFIERQGWRLAELFDENEVGSRDVSGGADPRRRPGFGPALELIEQKRAQVIVAADLSRLFRDIDHQRATIAAVESAGGEFWTVANGRVTHATAEAELTANIHGSMNHFQRRYAKEKSFLAVEVAIEQGRIPWSQTAPGYRRTGGEPLLPDPKLVDVISKAFELRDTGASIAVVREHLTEHGVSRSYHGVQHLLRDRVYVGEIHFGSHTPNLAAHEPIVERDLFERVQAVKVSRGRRARSDRLLARLGVLRCGNCGSRMVVGSSHNSEYAVYRCPPVSDCPQHQTISAEIVEGHVAELVRQAAQGPAGAASRDNGTAKLLAAVDDSERKLKGTIVTFVAAGIEAEPDAVQRLTELRQQRDQAKAAYANALGKDRNRRVILIAADWDRLDLQGRRDLVTATIDTVTVAPEGRGADRLRFTMTTAAGDFGSAAMTVEQVRRALSRAANRIATGGQP